MFTSTFTRAMLALGSLAVLAVNAAPAPSAHNLPIFFFHGINSAATSGDLLKANLSTDARPFIGLTSCETFCTLSDLNTQADLAAKEIRGIVANDSRFDNGYLFIGHSLGGAVARAVIETMDDHKVHSFFSLAGANNGLAYGSQESDVFAAQVFLKYYAPVFYGSLINASSYSVADIQSGKLTADLATLLPNHPEISTISGIQFARSPVQDEWIKYNTFYAPLNNLQAPTTEAIKLDQARRKRNFLKLKEAHFFGSPFDETISPWQSSQLGAYQPVASVAEWTANFKNIKVQTYTETVEYKQDTYGLQTLDKRGGIFMHTFDNVPHNGWIRDTTGPRDGKNYTFLSVYEKGLYPLIAPDATVTTPTPTTPKPYC